MYEYTETIQDSDGWEGARIQGMKLRDSEIVEWLKQRGIVGNTQCGKVSFKAEGVFGSKESVTWEQL